jgi:hypothetical protein
MTTEIITVSIGIYLLIVLALIIQAFVDFYLDLLIVTEDRVILVRQNGYFNQQIDESHISDIDEVGVDVSGIINSAIGCGNVIIHMGNDEAILTVADIQNAEKVSREIMQLHKTYIDKTDPKKEDDNKDKDKDKE